MFKVGTVINYYDKTQVAIIELIASLTTGEKVTFVYNHNNLFEQIIESVRVGHVKASSANAGEVVGLKTHGMVQKGTEIFKAQS